LHAFFSLIKIIRKEKDILPRNVFNCDECGIDTKELLINKQTRYMTANGGRHSRTDRLVPGVAAVRPLAFHATWTPTLNISSLSSITFHVARFLRDSLYVSNIRYNGLHHFSGSYGHADRPDPA